jgi:NADP-dependent 3-hydroxy acid dehydrogenase YdfG
MSALFENDAALVTGSGSGIGRAIAEALRGEGVRVIGADLKGSDLDVDLSKPGEAQRLAAEAIAKLGKVSIFVHSASPRRHEEDTALEVSEDTWRAMQEVNLNAGFLLGQALGRHMRERKLRGRMLYITSLHAYAARNLPHYSAAKAGQTMLVASVTRARSRACTRRASARSTVCGCWHPRPSSGRRSRGRPAPTASSASPSTSGSASRSRRRSGSIQGRARSAMRVPVARSPSPIPIGSWRSRTS